MPDFPSALNTPRIETNNFTINVVGVGGDKSSTSIEYADTVTGAELADWRADVMALSNAGVFKTNASLSVEIPIRKAGPLDEAHSSVKEKLIMIFQDDSLDVKQFGIPAPDSSYFVGDGITAITPNASAPDVNGSPAPAKLLANAVASTRLILNNGAAATGNAVGTYEYVRGYRSRPGMPAPRYDPTIAYEPTSSTEPGPESDPEGDEGA